MNSYITRLTPNSNKWEKPSGHDCKCGLNTNSPYEGVYGFGWEEWLFNDYHNASSQLDGYCYGFIQAFHKQNNDLNKIKTLHLYSRLCGEKGRKNYYLGYIQNLEIVKPPITTKSLNEKKNAFFKKAYIDLNNAQIEGFENDLNEMFNEDTLFNVRFKPTDVHISDFNFQTRPITIGQGQSRFKLYDLEKHVNLHNEINQYLIP